MLVLFLTYQALLLLLCLLSQLAPLLHHHHHTLLLVLLLQLPSHAPRSPATSLGLGRDGPQIRIDGHGQERRRDESPDPDPNVSDSDVEHSPIPGLVRDPRRPGRVRRRSRKLIGIDQ